MVPAGWAGRGRGPIEPDAGGALGHGRERRGWMG